MPTIERKWPKIYQVLAILSILLIVAAPCLYLFLISPLEEQFEDATDNLESAKAKIAKSEWDASDSGIANASKLYSLAIGSAKQPAAQQWTDELIKNATAHLVKLVEDVKKTSQNPHITEDGKKTYSDKYDEIKKELQTKHIELVPAVYGLSRVSEGNYYNMTLKLLLTKELVDLLAKHHLSIMRTIDAYAPETEQLAYMGLPTPQNTKKIHASELTALPIKSFAIVPTAQPSLLAIPIQAAVQGTLANFLEFSNDLRKDDRWYALANIEIQTVKPVLRGTRKAQLIESQEDEKSVHLEKITARFVCIGYALPENAPIPGTPASKASQNSVIAPKEVSEKPIGI